MLQRRKVPTQAQREAAKNNSLPIDAFVSATTIGMTAFVEEVIGCRCVITNQKETEMTKFNVETLMALANVSVKDEFSQYDALPANIQAALKRKMKEQEEAKAEAAAESVLFLINSTDECIKRRVDRIRDLRREVERLKGEITHIERAKEYGMKTQNFVPLAAGLGFVSHGIAGAQIPESFTVAKTAAKK